MVFLKYLLFTALFFITGCVKKDDVNYDNIDPVSNIREQTFALAPDFLYDDLKDFNIINEKTLLENTEILTDDSKKDLKDLGTTRLKNTPENKPLATTGISNNSNNTATKKLYDAIDEKLKAKNTIDNLNPDELLKKLSDIRSDSKNTDTLISRL